MQQSLRWSGGPIAVVLSTSGYLRPEMEEALGIWVAKGERLAERKRNVEMEVEKLMKELEGLRVSEGLVEERKNMLRGWMELPELPE